MGWRLLPAQGLLVRCSAAASSTELPQSLQSLVTAFQSVPDPMAVREAAAAAPPPVTAAAPIASAGQHFDFGLISAVGLIAG